VKTGATPEYYCVTGDCNGLNQIQITASTANYLGCSAYSIPVGANFATCIYYTRPLISDTSLACASCNTVGITTGTPPLCKLAASDGCSTSTFLVGVANKAPPQCATGGYISGCATYATITAGGVVSGCQKCGDINITPALPYLVDSTSGYKICVLSLVTDCAFYSTVTGKCVTCTNNLPYNTGLGIC
jgi:hypothetical protein